MKNHLVYLIIAIGVTGYSQSRNLLDTIILEKQIKYVRENFQKTVDKIYAYVEVEHEDASSTFFTKYYYDDKGNVKLIRNVWNGGVTNPPKIYDYYFDEKRVILFEELVDIEYKWQGLDEIENHITLMMRKSYFLKDEIITGHIENNRHVNFYKILNKEKLQRWVLSEAEAMISRFKKASN